MVRRFGVNCTSIGGVRAIKMRTRPVGDLRRSNCDAEFIVTTRTEAAGSLPAGEAPRRIAMLIYPGVAPLDVTGPLQVFGVANFLRRQKLYDVITVAPTADPVPTPLGFAFLPACAMTALPMPVDTLLVSGGGGPDDGNAPAILDWLRRTTPKTRRFGSICTGAFALGAAGLIDGKRVTTHWAFISELARRNPGARVEAEPIFIRDGSLCSSAGSSAGIDLALALLEDDHGREFALTVARYLMLFHPRPGGQPQFSNLLQAQPSSGSAIQKVQRWCHHNLAGDLRVSELARNAAMSERSFIRAFREIAGVTPAEFVMSARLQAARQLLEETRLAPKAISQRCGFGSAAAMRRVFKRRIGILPLQYRDQFRARDVEMPPAAALFGSKILRSDIEVEHGP